MRPRPPLLYLLALWAALGLGASFAPQLQIGWVFAGGTLLLIAILDAMLLLTARRPEITREIPARLAVGLDQEVHLAVTNSGATPMRLEIFDGLPESVHSTQMPWNGVISGRGKARISYMANPTERGVQTFSACHVLQASPFRLWNKFYRCGAKDEVRVYPNFEPVLRFSLLAMSNRVEQMGIVAYNRAGISREFHQLRDYQDGDVLNQIDWKATSRRHSLISREYREQRDQSILFAVDCGRRMRVLDGEITQFDHCLNAILLLSYIALRQGDGVGVMGFGGSNRWLPPVKGVHAMSSLLNHLYDYQTSSQPTDFAEAAEQILARQKRRSLVIFLTNLRSEDSEHVVKPLQILKKKHVVLLATLREQEISDKLVHPVRNLSEAVTLGATHLYLEERAALLQDLRRQGILTLDASAKELPVALANSYLEIKREGRI